MACWVFLCIQDLLQAVIPFDILLDRRKRTKFLNNFRQCSEVSNTKAKVVTDAGIALASLVVCEEALEQELFISTSYVSFQYLFSNVFDAISIL